MTLTDIRDQLVLMKQQILAQANLYPAAADQLNIALAHLNDSANIVGVLAMQLDPQKASATEVERAALDRISELEAALERAGVHTSPPADTPVTQPTEDEIRRNTGTPETRAAYAAKTDGSIDPDVTTEGLDLPRGHDAFAGEGVDPDASLELGDPATVAAEASRKNAEEKGRTDPDQGRVDW